jgi:16S rRNA U516 pseudouridylate synthase RsuA-like enzyme
VTSSDNSPESQLRLNKYVAVSLGVSRRQADKLIEQGNILINNSPAELGARISPNDIVNYNGKQITPKTYKLIALQQN